MKCLVTGISGFIGGHVARDLIRRGHQVRGFHRQGADLRAVADLEFESFPGDLTDRDAVMDSVRGCEQVYHVGAAYSLWMRNYSPMYAANVDGTRFIFEAAARHGADRVIYTSTVGCVGVPHRRNRDASGRVIPTNESAFLPESAMLNPYKHSKWLAEQLALEKAAAGQPIVIVNPSAPVGPGDIKPTPTGQVILDFIRRKMPAYLDTGLNWVDVRDVAAAHFLAGQVGVPGQRYILGNQEGNWTMKQFLECLSDLTGLPAPRFQVPYAVAWTAALVDESIARWTGRPPTAPMGGVRMAKNLMWFDPSRAVRELGMPQNPLKSALLDAVQDLRIRFNLPESR